MVSSRLAVVADDDRPAAPAREQIDHCLAPVPIEIVGGLVEQQEVRLGEDQRGQTNPRDLPARQAVQLRVGSDIEPDTRKGGCKPRFERPVDLGDLLGRGIAPLGTAKQIQRMRARRTDRSPPRPQEAGRPGAADRRFR